MALNHLRLCRGGVRRRHAGRCGFGGDRARVAPGAAARSHTGRRCGAYRGAVPGILWRRFAPSRRGWCRAWQPSPLLGRCPVRLEIAHRRQAYVLARHLHRPECHLPRPAVVAIAHDECGLSRWASTATRMSAPLRVTTPRIGASRLQRGYRGVGHSACHNVLPE